MAFNSSTYFLFFLLVFLLFYLSDGRWRWLILLTASFVFYGTLAVPWLPLVLVLVIIITYGAGLGIYSGRTDSGKRLYFWGGVGANILILASLKYLPVAAAIKLPVAVGLSYYVFQSVSYLADIRKKIIEPERHIGYFALYLSFFPKLLQGPIERASDLLPQLKQPYTFDYNMARSGLFLFTWGLFKKIVVADRLALFVNPVFGDVHSYQGIPLIMATYFYTFQIYMDFSGYTDMALGSARLFNIRLTQNFNSPYLATSVSDFWKRWHITLSRFLKDYLYIPLGGSRNGSNRRSFNLIVTMLLCGLWHGAGYTFVIWGGIHGIFLTASAYYKPVQKKIHGFLGVDNSILLKVWQIFVTFNIISFAWIFFRANNLSDALYITTHLTTGLGETLANLYRPDIFAQNILIGIKKLEFVLIICLIGFTFFTDWLQKSREIGDLLFHRPAWFRWPAYYLLIFSILILGIFGESQFIYFRF
jgi:D-alanyl-lipoteichoic acid acyltransferase DltB (MBOAT superfamily)